MSETKQALPNSLFFNGIVVELPKNSDCKITEQGKIIHKFIGVWKSQTAKRLIKIYKNLCS